MKILLISPKMDKPNGGIAVWTKYYEKGCQELDISYRIVNTEIIKKGNNRRFFGELQRTKRIFKSLKNLLKEDSYDIAHLNSNIGNFGIIRDYYMAKRILKRNIPLVVHFHCDISFWVTNPVVKYYLKKLLNISKINFVLCENSRKYLKGTFGVESIKVPNFIDKKLIVTEKIINNILKKVVFVGRVSLDKGAKEIYELAKRFPYIDFNLIGEVSREVAQWEKLANLHLLGPLPNKEVLAHLDDSDLFLFPSHTEGFSVALAEGMARGIPSIATDVGANFDMLENKGGFVVSKGDIDSMEKCLKQLLDPSVRKKMSKWCIDKVLNNYTTSKVMEELLLQYSNL